MESTTVVTGMRYGSD